MGWKTVSSDWSATPSPSRSDSAYADATHDVMVSGTLTERVSWDWPALEKEREREKKRERERERERKRERERVSEKKERKRERSSFLLQTQ